MPRWLRDILPRIRELAHAKRVRFTYKALRELDDLGLGLDSDDCCDVLEHLTVADSDGRFRSLIGNEWMYLFTPTVMGTKLYLKVIVRGECVIISFHEADYGGD